MFSQTYNPLDAYRSHVEHTVGGSVEVRFISMSITSQLQHLGVSWEMQTAVNIGTIIKPDRAQYSLKCRFQIGKMTVWSTNTYSCINSWLRFVSDHKHRILGNVRRKPKECLTVLECIREALLRQPPKKCSEKVQKKRRAEEFLKHDLKVLSIKYTSNL